MFTRLLKLNLLESLCKLEEEVRVVCDVINKNEENIFDNYFSFIFNNWNFFS